MVSFDSQVTCFGHSNLDWKPWETSAGLGSGLSKSGGLEMAHGTLVAGSWSLRQGVGKCGDAWGK